MAVEIEELFDSRELTESISQQTWHLHYGISGTDDELEARAALLAECPETIGSETSSEAPLERQEISLKPLGAGLWDAMVTYAVVLDDEYTFSTTGGTQNIKQSLRTIRSYEHDVYQTRPDLKGAIGQTDERIEGVDIHVPQFTFQIKKRFPLHLMTDEYRVLLMGMTGRTNSLDFRGFKEGELLFLGAEGGQRGRDKMEITFHFAASENRDDIKIPGFTAIDDDGQETEIEKKGWEYLWIRYRPRIDTTQGTDGIKRYEPWMVFVEKVYDAGEFQKLFPTG